MKAITIIPGKAGSATVQDVPEPDANEGDVLVRALELGICGTDFELVSGQYGWAPKNSDYLILGHESLGVVESAPSASGFHKGDLVVGIVRRPDPVPCIGCAVGEWDMCRNDLYTERGIKEIHGFGSELWRNESEYLIKLDSRIRPIGVLMEPASVLAKAWDHVERIGRRAEWKPKTVLVTGAGPIGLLGAMMGRQRGLEVHVLDRVTSGLKPQLVADLGAEYHTGSVHDLNFRPDIILECTGVCSLIVDSMSKLDSDGILCLAGVSSRGQTGKLDVGELNRRLVLENCVIFGSVNANRRHWQLAGQALSEGDHDWLSRLISRREPLANWHEVLERKPDDIKVVVQF
jgi:threonine dehydrogenase-like Zn-dependent dehydrogenase